MPGIPAFLRPSSRPLPFSGKGKEPFVFNTLTASVSADCRALDGLNPFFVCVDMPSGGPYFPKGFIDSGV